MKRIFALMMAAVMVFALCACGGAKEEKAPAETAAEAEKVVFKQGFDLDYPPYSFRTDDGEVGGFDVEVCQAVCAELGWEYEAVPFNWDAKDAELNAGSCDCIWSGITIEGREDDYCWTVPYSNNTQMILVPENSEIKTLADLAGKVVGVQTATSAYDLLDEGDQAELKASFASLEVYETYTIAFNDLMAGAIDAIAIDVTSGNFLMSKNPGYMFLDEVLGSETYGIAFRKGDEALRDQVWAGFLKVVESGKFAEIAENYPEIKDYLVF